MQLGKRIKALREGLDLSQTDLANKTGLHRSQLSSLENENMSPFQDFTKYKLLGDILKADPHELWEMGQRDRQEWKAKEYLVKAKLLRPDMSEKFIRPIPILSKVPNSIPDNPEDFPSEIITGSYDPIVKDPKAFMYEVEGDFMAPEIKKGDLLLICPSHIDKIKSGDIVAIRNNKGTRRLRRVVLEHDQIILIPENSNYPVIIWRKKDGPEIIGRVKEIIRRR